LKDCEHILQLKWHNDVFIVFIFCSECHFSFFVFFHSNLIVNVKTQKENTTEPQPDQLSKFWIEQILRLIHFYKLSKHLIFIINTGGEGPQLPFSENFSRTSSQNTKTTFRSSTSPQSTRFWKIWIDSFLRLILL